MLKEELKETIEQIDDLDKNIAHLIDWLNNKRKVTLNSLKEKKDNLTKVLTGIQGDFFFEEDKTGLLAKAVDFSTVPLSGTFESDSEIYMKYMDEKNNALIINSKDPLRIGEPRYFSGDEKVFPVKGKTTYSYIREWRSIIV